MADQYDRSAGTATPERQDPAQAPAGTTTAADPAATRHATAVDDAAAARRAGARARVRHGGFDWLATFLGFTTAFFFLSVFLGIVGGYLGFTGYRSATGSVTAMAGATPVVAAGVGTLVATFLAYFIGGYASGRLARYDGLVNGLGVVLWTVIVAILVGIAGAILNTRFQATQHLTLGVNVQNLTIGAVISAVIILVVMLIGGALGGMLGAHYHRRVDRDLGAIA